MNTYEGELSQLQQDKQTLSQIIAKKEGSEKGV